MSKALDIYLVAFDLQACLQLLLKTQPCSDGAFDPCNTCRTQRADAFDQFCLRNRDQTLGVEDASL